MTEESVTWKEFREWQRLEEKRIFYTHLAAYIVFNIFFIYVNLTKTPTIIWFYYPLSAWGCGVLLHYLSAIGMFDYVYENTKKDVKDSLKSQESKP